jgi:hypothetical protein
MIQRLGLRAAVGRGYLFVFISVIFCSCPQEVQGLLQASRDGPTNAAEERTDGLLCRSRPVPSLVDEVPSHKYPLNPQLYRYGSIQHIRRGPRW